MVYICDFICFLFGPQAGVLFLSIISFFHLLSWLWHPVSVLLGLVEMTISEFNASESDLRRFGDASQRGWPWKVSSLSLPYPRVVVNVWIYFGFTSQSYCIVRVHLGFPTLVFLLPRLLHFWCGMSLVQGSQRSEVLYPLELGLQLVLNCLVWVLGYELRSSVKAMWCAYPLNPLPSLKSGLWRSLPWTVNSECFHGAALQSIHWLSNVSYHG